MWDCRETVHDGHTEIEDHHIGPFLARDVDCCRAVARFPYDLEASIQLQRQPKHQSDLGHVIDKCNPANRVHDGHCEGTNHLGTDRIENKAQND
jgi:hypothetical protein